MAETSIPVNGSSANAGKGKNGLGGRRVKARRQLVDAICLFTGQKNDADSEILDLKLFDAKTNRYVILGEELKYRK